MPAFTGKGEERRDQTEKRATAAVTRIVLTLVLAAVPLVVFAKGYVLFQATMVLAYAVALLGLNLLTGYNGQISLGHGAFFALGAYTVAVVTGHVALGEIRRAPDSYEGRGMAVVGVVLGWLNLALTAMVIAAFFLFFGGLALLTSLVH